MGSGSAPQIQRPGDGMTPSPGFFFLPALNLRENVLYCSQPI